MMLRIKKFCAWLAYKGLGPKLVASMIIVMFAVSIGQRTGILTQDQGNTILIWLMVFLAGMTPGAFVGVLSLDVLDEYQHSRARQMGEKFPEFAGILCDLSRGRKEYLDEWLKKFDANGYEELAEKRDVLRKTVIDAPQDLQEVEARLRRVESDLAVL